MGGVRLNWAQRIAMTVAWALLLFQVADYIEARLVVDGWTTAAPNVGVVSSGGEADARALGVWIVAIASWAVGAVLLLRTPPSDVDSNRRP